MRRSIRFILPLLLAVTLLVALLVAVRMNLPPDWQLELDKYVQYKDSVSSGTTTVRLVDRASKPWNFSREMSHAVFGDSPYYQTDYSYSGERRSGPKPLPFPPDDVWCVLLDRDHGTRTIVFVAEHQDLYDADVVIHEGASDLSSQSSVENVSQIGCDLVLAQLRPSDVRP